MFQIRALSTKSPLLGSACPQLTLIQTSSSPNTSTKHQIKNIKKKMNNTIDKDSGGMITVPSSLIRGIRNLLHKMLLPHYDTSYFIEFQYDYRTPANKTNLSFSKITLIFFFFKHAKHSKNFHQ